MTITFRCFFDAKDSAIAARRAGVIRDRFREVISRTIILSRRAHASERGLIDGQLKDLRINASPVKAYWKVSGWYEAAFEVRIPRGNDAQALLHGIAPEFADEWHWVPDGTSAIAAESSKSIIKIPGVHWIELVSFDSRK